MSSGNGVNAKLQGRTFVVNTPVRDLGTYRQLATMVSRLKKHGQVEMNISALAEKSRHEIPDGGSPWHEYAACNPTVSKFFPDPMLERFIPSGFVSRNRQLLLAKANILREIGLGAAFWSYEPNFLPEAFFTEYPSLRGPRTDHPRRSLHDEFAPCVDEDVTREMTSRMVEQLVKHVPELGTYFFKTNDAGPGLCWSDWLYTGVNGPHTCRDRPIGLRVKDLIESIQQGAQRAGGRLRVHLTGNFSEREVVSIRDELPDDAYLREAGSGSLNIGTIADLCYPARGILDLIGTLTRLQGYNKPNIRTVFIDLRTFYDRSYETLAVSEKIVETVDDFIADPAWGTIAIYQRARQLCERWVGAKQADVLFEAMVQLNEAIKFKRAALPRVTTIYGAVSARYINRPLLAIPELLAPEDENYFLPHIFNVCKTRARLDYVDIHGTRMTPTSMGYDNMDPRVWPVYSMQSKLEKVARQLDQLDDPCWIKMAGALRLYGNLLKSSANFYAVQVIRDRCPTRFSGGEIDVPRQGNPQGDAELMLLNEIMRDELDTSLETISLLKKHGLEIISHATVAEDEDTFLLGPDVVAQIERKCALMRKHWRDAERYFRTPNK